MNLVRSWHFDVCFCISAICLQADAICFLKLLAVSTRSNPKIINYERIINAERNSNFCPKMANSDCLFIFFTEKKEFKQLPLPATKQWTINLSIFDFSDLPKMFQLVLVIIILVKMYSPFRYFIFISFTKLFLTFHGGPKKLWMTFYSPILI